MRIIIPAAGLGKRLQPSTYFLPKPLLYIGKKRMIDYIMDTFKTITADETVFIVGYKSEMIENYMKENYRGQYEYVYQNMQAGLGDAVMLGIENFKDKNDDSLIVLLSDTIVDINIKKFASGKSANIAVKKVNNPESFGIVEIKEGKIVNLAEKPRNPKSDLAIVGLYFFPSFKILYEHLLKIKTGSVRTAGEFQLTDAMKSMLDSGLQMNAHEIKTWIDCGNYDLLIKSNKDVLKADKLKNYIEESDVADSKIESNVSVFKNSKIKNCRIKDSIIFPDSTLENCVLINSVIGEGCNISDFKGQIICGDKTLIKGKIKKKEQK